MQKHTKIYMDFFGYDIDDFIPCEVSWSEGISQRANDVHHINGRGKGKDIIENLMGVSRQNHERCENKRKPFISKEKQKEIHQEFMKKFPAFIIFVMLVISPCLSLKSKTRKDCEPAFMVSYKPQSARAFYFMETEIWKSIINWEGVYEVSSQGRIRSLFRNIPYGNHRIRTQKERIMSTHLYNGYPAIILQKDLVRIPWKVHRLVAIAFIPNLENKPEVNHINGIKTDNRVENLEWVTHKENMTHAINTGLIKTNGQTGKFGSAHHRSKSIYQYSKEGLFIAEYGSQYEATRVTGVGNAGISMVCNGRKKIAGGFVWKFTKDAV